MVIGTAEAVRGHLEVAAINPYCPAVEQGTSYLLTG